MSIIAAALRELIAAGVTGDALVAAVERVEEQAIEAAIAAALEPLEAAEAYRRTLNARRQRRYRQRHVTLHDVSNATNPTCNVTNVTRHIDKSSSSSESISKKRKKVSLPENWMPNENGIALAREQGWDEHKIKLEIHRFKDHAQQHNRQYADWDAAWRNWVTSPYQHKGNGNGSRAPTVQDAFDLALNRLSGDAVEGNPPMVDVTPRRN